MRRSASIAPASVLLLALTGCSTLVPQDYDPGPVELTIEQAGERYLDIVCPNNDALDLLGEAYKAGEQEHLNGGAPDHSTVTAAAKKLTELNRLAVEHFDDEYFTWPEEVAEQIPHMRAIYVGELTMNEEIADSNTYSEAYNVPLPQTTPAMDNAAQEIRYQLDIPSDTYASCVGHENGLTELTEERTAREAALVGRD